MGNLFVVLCVVLALVAARQDSTRADRRPQPQLGFVSWFSMMFAAGMGVGLLYWGVAEPVGGLHRLAGHTPERRAAQRPRRRTPRWVHCAVPLGPAPVGRLPRHGARGGLLRVQQGLALRDELGAVAADRASSRRAHRPGRRHLYRGADHLRPRSVAGPAARCSRPPACTWSSARPTCCSSMPGAVHRSGLPDGRVLGLTTGIEDRHPASLQPQHRRSRRAAAGVLCRSGHGHRRLPDGPAGGAGG